MTIALLTYAAGLMPAVVVFTAVLDRQRYYAPAAAGAFMALVWPALVAYIVAAVLGGRLAATVSRTARVVARW